MSVPAPPPAAPHDARERARASRRSLIAFTLGGGMERSAGVFAARGQRGATSA